MALYQNEKYVVRKQASHFNKKGQIGLTNMRVLWLEHNASEPSVSIDISSITLAEKRSDNDKSILKVDYGRKTGKAFVFNAADHRDDIFEFNLKLQKEMNDAKNVNEAKSITKFRKLGRLSKIKLKKLAENPNLHELHQKLVL